jgi:hypothetical protein
VLWFEADLYDQLQVIQILAMLSELEVTPDRITLVCIGSTPASTTSAGSGSSHPSSSADCPTWPPRR